MPSNNGKKRPSNRYDDYDDGLDELLESIDKENSKKHLKNAMASDDVFENENGLDSIDYEDDFDYDMELDFEDEDYYGDYDDEDDEDIGFFESFTKGKMAIISGVFTSIVLIIMVFIAAFAGRKEALGQNSDPSVTEQGTAATQKATPVVNKNENGEMISASLNVTLVPGYVRPDGSSGGSGWSGNSGGSHSGSGNSKPTKTPDNTATPTPGEQEYDVTPTPEVTATPTPDVETPTQEATPSPIEGDVTVTPEVTATPTPNEGEVTSAPTEEATPSPTPEAVPTDIPAVTEPTVEPSDDTVQ